MSNSIILASASITRRAMLDAAGIDYISVRPAIDEQAIKQSMTAENFPPDQISDYLAESKARKISLKHPESVVIGSDQILAFDDKLLSKSVGQEQAFDQLMALRGKTHFLYSAAVIIKDTKPIWRLTKTSRMTMREFSPEFIQGYIDRNWPSIQTCVGGYQIEAEGARLFSRINGDQFSIMGMPLLEILNYLSQTKLIDG